MTIQAMTSSQLLQELHDSCIKLGRDGAIDTSLQRRIEQLMVEIDRRMAWG